MVKQSCISNEEMTKKRKSSNKTPENQILNDVMLNLFYITEENSGDVTKEGIKNYLDQYFRWEQVSYVKPMQKLKASNGLLENDEWRLTVRLNEKHNLYRPFLKIKTSTIHNAGYGLFSDKTFMEGDYIGVYLGFKKKKTDNLTPYSFTFDTQCKPHEFLDPEKGIKHGALLFLGCHMINDKIHLGFKEDKRKNGMPNLKDIL